MRASTPSRSPWRTGSAAAGPAVPVGAGQPVLRAQHLSKSYHSPVLRDLDLDVEQGQFVAIMGPSGSGKSTLLHCLSGMDQPDAGSVLLGGQEITSLSEKELAALRLTRFGFVFQQAHLMTTLCLLDNIVLPGFLAGLRPRSEVTARGEELMERMGIAKLATRSPAASCSAQASAGPSSTTPGSSSPTNPPERSTPPPRCRSSTCSGRFMPRGRLWSWSPTTPRWRPGPTVSWCSWTGRSRRTCSWDDTRRLTAPHA